MRVCGDEERGNEDIQIILTTSLEATIHDLFTFPNTYGREKIVEMAA
jgi:hypothetical protein